MKTKKNFPWLTVIPFLILAVMLIIFGIIDGFGKILSVSNIESMFNQGFAIIVAGFGMVFATTMGGTDITHGALLGLAGGFACVAGGASAWLAFPAALLTGIASGALLGVLNARFRANTFMMSLAIMIAFKAINNTFFAANPAGAPAGLSFINNTIFKIVVLIVLFLIVLYVYNYTPYGVYLKGLGENEVAMKHVGINVAKIKIIAFIISGAMCAFAAVFNAVRIGSVDNKVGVSFEMNVMMAMFIGGIPVNGGMKSQLYKIIIGAFTIIILTNGLTLAGADSGLTQLIKGIVLLASVAFTLFLNRKISSRNEQAAVNQKTLDDAQAA
mgnify:FL=1